LSHVLLKNEKRLVQVSNPDPAFVFFEGSGHLMKLSLGNDKGFTLVEILAVLIILGIVSAVAVTKYLNVADEARKLAAQGAIAEIKGRLSTAQAKYMMANSGKAPTSTQLYTYATTGTNAYNSTANLSNVGTDFTVTTATGTPITITVSAVGGVTLGASVVGIFTGVGDP
jgi:MSHA pilin protein MshA